MRADYRLSEMALKIVEELRRRRPYGMTEREIAQWLGLPIGDPQVSQAMTDLRHYELIRRKTKDGENRTVWRARRDGSFCSFVNRFQTPSAPCFVSISDTHPIVSVGLLQTDSQNVRYGTEPNRSDSEPFLNRLSARHRFTVTEGKP